VSGRVRAVALAVAVVALAGALLASGRTSRGPHLVVEDLRAARILHRERVRPGALFTLDYIHSSERVPVRGTFRIEHEGALTVVETAFAGFGPGLPQIKPGDDWRVEGGMIVHRPPGEPLNELRVRVTPVARQRLTTPAGRTLDLAALTPPGTPVLVSVR
jgi:hypothetical protein